MSKRSHTPESIAETLKAIAKLPPTAYLTSRQAAAYLGTTPGVLANWRSMRLGPRYHGFREFIRYRKGDLDELMAARAGEVLCGRASQSIEHCK